MTPLERHLPSVGPIRGIVYLRGRSRNAEGEPLSKTGDARPHHLFAPGVAGEDQGTSLDEV